MTLLNLLLFLLLALCLSSGIVSADDSSTIGTASPSSIPTTTAISEKTSYSFGRPPGLPFGTVGGSSKCTTTYVTFPRETYGPTSTTWTSTVTETRSLNCRGCVLQVFDEGHIYLVIDYNTTVTASTPTTLLVPACQNTADPEHHPSVMHPPQPTPPDNPSVSTTISPSESSVCSSIRSSIEATPHPPSCTPTDPSTDATDDGTSCLDTNEDTTAQLPGGPHDENAIVPRKEKEDDLLHRIPIVNDEGEEDADG